MYFEKKYSKQLRKKSVIVVSVLHQSEVKHCVMNIHYTAYLYRYKGKHIQLTCTYRQQDCVVCHVGYGRKDRRSPGDKDAMDDDTALSCNESAHTSDLRVNVT